MTDTAAPVSRPAWQAVLLVCKACRKRADLPVTLKGKAVAAACRRGLPKAGDRPRVVLCGCLGLCPKSAVAVALVGGRNTPQIAAVHAPKQIAPTVKALLASAAD